MNPPSDQGDSSNISGFSSTADQPITFLIDLMSQHIENRDRNEDQPPMAVDDDIPSDDEHRIIQRTCDGKETDPNEEDYEPISSFQPSQRSDVKDGNEIHKETDVLTQDPDQNHSTTQGVHQDDGHAEPAKPSAYTFELPPIPPTQLPPSPMLTPPPIHRPKNKTGGLAQFPISVDGDEDGKPSSNPLPVVVTNKATKPEIAIETNLPYARRGDDDLLGREYNKVDSPVCKPPGKRKSKLKPSL